MATPDSVDFSTFVAEANTGDVLLWSGTSLDSVGVDLVSWSLYSHSSIVAKHPGTGDKFLLQSVNADLGQDMISTPPKIVPPVGGVQGQALETVVRYIYSNFGDIPSWVQLEWPDRPD